MNSVIYRVLGLLWLTYGLTVGHNEFFESSESENDWDPSKDFFDEYTVEEKVSPKYSSEDSRSKRKNSEQYDNKENLRYKAYLTRFINIFLRSSGFSEDVFEDDSKTLRVDLTLSKEDFAILKKFGSDEDISLATLENSFRSMFDNKHYFNIETSVVMEYLKYAILLALLLAIVTYTFFMIRKINFKITAISFILFTAYISIVLHGLLKQYEDLSENIVIRRMEFDNQGTPPKECFYSKMSYLEKMYIHIFKDDTCQRFLQSRKSIWYEIDLVSAFIKPFQSIFSLLCSMLGEGSEKMIRPFIDKSPWPISVVLELFVIVMELPLLYFGIFLIFIAFTSGRVFFKMPYIFSMGIEKSREMKYDHSSKNPNEENKSRSIEGPIKTYVINKGGIVLLGNEDKQFQSYSIQGSSSLNFNSQPQTLKISQQSNGPFMKRETAYVDDIKSRSIFNKHLARNKKEVRRDDKSLTARNKKEVRREDKSLTYSKKMNFKPNKRSVALKAKENLDILPVYLES